MQHQKKLSKKKNSHSILELTNPLILNIVKFLDQRTLVYRVSLVSKSFNSIVNQEETWKLLANLKLKNLTNYTASQREVLLKKKLKELEEKAKKQEELKDDKKGKKLKKPKKKTQSTSLKQPSYKQVFNSLPDDHFKEEQKVAFIPIVKEKKNLKENIIDDLKKSKIGGVGFLKPNETHIDCPNCKKPMSLFLQLNSKDLPESQKTLLLTPKDIESKTISKLFQFFKCTNEDCLHDYDKEKSSHLFRVISSNSKEFNGSNYDKTLVEINEDPMASYDLEKLKNMDSFNLNKPMVFKEKLIVGWKKEKDYPQNLEKKVTEEIFEMLTEWPIIDEKGEDYYYQKMAIKADKLGMEWYFKTRKYLKPISYDKLGGFPFYVQGNELPNCKICKKPMIHFFQLSSYYDSSDFNSLQESKLKQQLNYMWGDCGTAHINVCKDHKDQFELDWAGS